ncbi:MAG: hypothetical protein WBA13_12550 [Microcoleaceae cyanobacterium]
MFQLLYFFIHAVQPILVPLCLVLAWGFVILLISSVLGAIRDTVRRAQQMHQIPCADCTFFTKDYHLKCPVQPMIALSEQAINCPDYCTNRKAPPGSD